MLSPKVKKTSILSPKRYAGISGKLKNHSQERIDAKEIRLPQIGLDQESVKRERTFKEP